MQSQTHGPIAITMGDPAGIGPEIIARAFRDSPEVTRGCFVAGDTAALRRAAEQVARGAPVLPVALLALPGEALDLPPRCLPVPRSLTLRPSTPGMRLS